MYRFDDVIGNKEVVSYLRNTIKNGKVSHAYIISGAKGSGKRLLANTYAKALQCESMEERPCGSCISCRTFDAGNNPDVIYLSPAKTKYLGVQDIRERLNSDIEIKPYRNRYKIYILTGTEKMSAGAQNALLKTIEEPPGYAVVMLLSDNAETFLPTITSRCVTLKLKPLQGGLVEDYLKGTGIPGDKAETAALYSMGSIGRGLLLATDSGFTEMRGKIIGILSGIYEKDLAGVFMLYKELEPFKDTITDCLDIASIWYRDILLTKELGSEYALQKDMSELIAEQAEIYDRQGLLNIISDLSDTKLKLLHNANFQLAMEILLIKIRRNIQG